MFRLPKLTGSCNFFNRNIITLTMETKCYSLTEASMADDIPIFSRISHFLFPVSNFLYRSGAVK